MSGARKTIFVDGRTVFTHTLSSLVRDVVNSDERRTDFVYEAYSRKEKLVGNKKKKEKKSPEIIVVRNAAGEPKENDVFSGRVTTREQRRVEGPAQNVL